MSTIIVDVVSPTIINNPVTVCDVPIIYKVSSEQLKIGTAISMLNTGARGTSLGVNNLSGTSGIENVAVGYLTLMGTQAGQKNTAVGSYAMRFNLTGSDNVALGHESMLYNTSGIQNVSIGANAGKVNQTGNQNTAVGNLALTQNNGPSNMVAIGASALMSSNGGASQTAVGSYALAFLGSGAGSNTALGYGAGYNSISGDSNVFIGANSALTNTTGSNNICLGTNSNVPSATTANSITLGNSSHTVLRCAVTSITALSDGRDKEDVAELTAGLEFVNELNPVSFVWNDRDEAGKHGVKDFGFIAQDLKATQEKYDMAETLGLVYEENPEKLEASYGKLIPILVKAIKELSAKVEALESKKKK